MPQTTVCTPDRGHGAADATNSPSSGAASTIATAVGYACAATCVLDLAGNCVMNQDL